MCGIAGLISKEVSVDGLKLVQPILHRGPDAGDSWSNHALGITLAHRRLSILDLSPNGSQPMTSATGRYVIVFNGEIYNFLELKKDLQHEGFVFKGASDTEILLACIEAYGIESTLERCVGMFAFASWDSQDKHLTLARDRFGEKPLYFGWLSSPKCFVFASELKCLFNISNCKQEIERESLGLLLDRGYISSPYSILKGIYKLPPASSLRISLSHLYDRPDFSAHVNAAASTLHPKLYWDLNKVAQKGQAELFTGSDRDAIDRLEEKLNEAISLQMIADVPVGAFLSGGVDSSTTVALMQKLSSQPIKTFSLGFNETSFDEAPFARAVAKHLGTDHTELYVSERDALDVVPLMPKFFDEPFGDSSQIPTFLLAKLVRSRVTVSLSGDAGDELFCGYKRYISNHKLWSVVSSIPISIRSLFSTALRVPSRGKLDVLASILKNLSKNRISTVNLIEKIRKLDLILRSESKDELNSLILTHWSSSDNLLLGQSRRDVKLSNCNQNFNNFFREMMLVDQLTYLVDDILVKVDRASMASSLESRIPMLDHRLVEFSWSLPNKMLVRNGTSKWILRQVLHRHVPKKLVERPKMGFGMPLDKWLRGSLRDWGESLLDEKKLINDGFLNAKIVRQHWERHQSGKSNLAGRLWDILMFQAWKEEFFSQN